MANVGVYDNSLSRLSWSESRRSVIVAGGVGGGVQPPSYLADPLNYHTEINPGGVSANPPSAHPPQFGSSSVYQSQVPVPGTLSCIVQKE